MRRILLSFVLILSGCLSAAPPGDLATLLAGRTMEYDPPEGTDAPPDRQSWKVDGTTIFHTYGLGRYPRGGFWRVERNRYCSTFPDKGQPPTQWTCFRVAIKEDGAVLEFTEIPKRRGMLFRFESFWRGRFVP